MSAPRIQKHQRETLERLGPDWKPVGHSGGTHLIVQHISGVRITLSCSPSDQNGMRVALRHARKALRQAQERAR